MQIQEIIRASVGKEYRVNFTSFLSTTLKVINSLNFISNPVYFILTEAKVNRSIEKNLLYCRRNKFRKHPIHICEVYHKYLWILIPFIATIVCRYVVCPFHYKTVININDHN